MHASFPCNWIHGCRMLDIIPLPGHTEDHIAVFDEMTGILLTGDSLYPGNLYIRDWATYKASIQRLVIFSQSHWVSNILGTHIEMTALPGVVFDFQSTHHPNEHKLQLTVDHLLELNRALTVLGGNPSHDIHDDFIIVPI